MGLALTHCKGKRPKRLVDTGGLAKKDRIAHRIEITGVREIDGEVKKWIKKAYELDGWIRPDQSSSPMRMAAPSTVVQRPRLSPTADWVTLSVRTILLEMR